MRARAGSDPGLDQDRREKDQVGEEADGHGEGRQVTELLQCRELRKGDAEKAQAEHGRGDRDRPTDPATAAQGRLRGLTARLALRSVANEEVSGGMFVGDSVGIAFPHGHMVQPVTPPPDFSHRAIVEQLRRMAGRQPEFVGFAHYGVAEDAGRVFEEAEVRLGEWVEFVEQLIPGRSPVESVGIPPVMITLAFSFALYALIGRWRIEEDYYMSKLRF